MSFSMCFVGPTTVVPRLETVSSADPSEVLIWSTEYLEELGSRFVVCGFGDESWPVDVGYDFAVVADQLGDVLEAVRLGLRAELCFDGQGVERCVEFGGGIGGRMELTCRSRVGWVPDPAVEHMLRVEVESMLVNLMIEFAKATLETWPSLALLPPVSEWISIAN